MSDKRKRSDEKVLVGPWRNVHAAIWLIGLAVLAWQDWWWPGILVLIALSMIAEAVIRQIPGAAAPKEEVVEPDSEEPPAAEPAQTPPQEPDPTKLPEKCQECGAPVSAGKVEWTSATTASCAYCGASLRMRE